MKIPGAANNLEMYSELSHTSRYGPQNEYDDYEYLFKLCIIGDPNCGKTNILSRYCNDKFNPYSVTTVAVEFVSKIVEIDLFGELKKIRL